MKNVFFVILIIVVLCFLIPVMFTVRYQAKETIANAAEEEEIAEVTIPQYHYGDYTKLKVLHRATGVIEEMDLDQYLVRSRCSRNAGRL